MNAQLALTLLRFALVLGLSGVVIWYFYPLPW